jgi:hypothetical protein
MLLQLVLLLFIDDSIGDLNLIVGKQQVPNDSLEQGKVGLEILKCGLGARFLQILNQSTDKTLKTLYFLPTFLNMSSSC